MTKRVRLIWRTLLACAIPVLVVTAILIVKEQRSEKPYVPGAEEDGITRSLDRESDAEVARILFTEVTAESGIAFDHFPFERTSQLPEDMGSGAAWGDYDADGLPDLFLINFGAPLGADDTLHDSSATDRLYRNLGDGRFEDVTARAGLARAHRGMGATWGDFDSDGWVDLFVTSFGENILWRNRGDGTFEDRTSQAGLEGEGYWAGAAATDFDLDGDLDIYVCGYVRYTTGSGSSGKTAGAGASDFPFTLNPSSFKPHVNRLYVNQGGGRFEDRAEALGVACAEGRSLEAVWADFNNDRLPDLYVANDVSDNAMFLNDGQGGFRDVSYPALVADYRGSMGLAIGDYDADLDLDLFITHWIAQENALYTNLSSDLSGRGDVRQDLIFSDDADAFGLGQIALDLIGWGTSFVDLDNDGWLDLFVANGSTFQRRDDPTLLVPMHPHLFWNRGEGKGFYEIGKQGGVRTDPPGVGRGTAFADYDRDGDLDLLVARHGGKARLLRNDSAPLHWIGIQLEGRTLHAAAGGARLVAHVGGRTLLREAGVGPSYLSQDYAGDVHFGVGAATSIDSLEVTWPGGERQVARELGVDRYWRWVEGEVPSVLSSFPHGDEARIEEPGDMSGDDGSPAVAERRTSSMSDHAVVSDVTSDLTPDQKRLFWNLNKKAAGQFTRDEWESAALTFAEMSRLDPLHEDALYYRGNCLLELERYEEAAESWERLVRINPSSSRAWMQIGLVHTLPDAGARFDLDQAAAAFERAHRINKEESRPLALLGEALLASGQADSARTVLLACHRMNPRETTALYLDGYLAWKRGDAEEAGKLLESATTSLEAMVVVAGVAGEGDTRDSKMELARRKAELRRLFGACVEALRGRTDLRVETVFSCVDSRLAEL